MRSDSDCVPHLQSGQPRGRLWKPNHEPPAFILFDQGKEILEGGTDPSLWDRTGDQILIMGLGNREVAGKVSWDSPSSSSWLEKVKYFQDYCNLTKAETDWIGIL